MPTLPGYYTTKEAAEKLGFKDQSSVGRLCAQGKINGAVKIGKMWLVPERWLEDMKKSPVDPKGNRGLDRKARN